MMDNMNVSIFKLNVAVACSYIHFAKIKQYSYMLSIIASNYVTIYVIAIITSYFLDSYS